MGPRLVPGGPFLLDCTLVPQRYPMGAWNAQLGQVTWHGHFHSLAVLAAAQVLQWMLAHFPLDHKVWRAAWIEVAHVGQCIMKCLMLVSSSMGRSHSLSRAL